MTERNLIVYIHDLDMTERNKNALMRFGIKTLNKLEQHYSMDFSEIRGLGVDSVHEIHTILEDADELFIQFEARKQRIDAVLGEVGDISVDELDFGNRACNALYRAGVRTIGDMIKMSKMDVAELRNVGLKTRDEISIAIEEIIAEGKQYINKCNISRTIFLTASEDPDQEDDAPQQIGKGFDFPVIDILTESFGFKTSNMADWFGLSRQAIYNAMEKRSSRRRSVWSGKNMTETEKSILCELIQEKHFDYSGDDVTCCCMNNKQDDFVCLFIYEDVIKCFFLKDLPEDLRKEITAANFQRYTEKELSGGIEGEIITVLKQNYFSPADLEVFRYLALSRGLSVDDYAQFLSGYPYIASRNVTDDQIVAFLEENMVDGKVYISSDPKNQWIRSYASRNGYGIKEFIEFYGYKSRLDGSELSSDGARVRHIEELKQYIVKDNSVYFPTDARIYRVLSTYAYQKETTINDYIKSLGFERITERPEVAIDVLEKDMQVYQSDGNFEEKVFACCPLIGSKILKQETLDKLNENTKKYINTILREPGTKLTLRAEMQITIALINAAKNWKNEENSNFWNYITLQFGYRDHTGAVVRLLQTALEDSMKKNQRFFIEDSNGRAFKSTVVIHALTTRKSWMALYDFLFDFYKNNLNWKSIPGDPLLDLMINTLQKKLAGDGEEDTELTISFKIYSFQEGIRKLILLRPVFTYSLFERLICRIDILINSIEKPVKTYEEQLCEEWFKEKITAIVSTKRTERQTQGVQRDVALDYSRIKAKYILKNETEVQLVLPDIRLKNEDIHRATLSIYYNSSLMHQQNMSWYGNELGKTLNGVTVTLPEFTYGSMAMDTALQIACDDKIIYNSEDTLSRRLLIFTAGMEVISSQVKKGNYTLIMPGAAAFDFENADVTEIDTFRNTGLKAFFVELKDGYMLSVDGRLISFDSEGGTDLRIIPPTETAGLPKIEIEGEEYQLAYCNSACSIILGNADLLQQFIILKDGERLELSSLPAIENGNGLALTCPLVAAKATDTCRIQIINIGDERLLFDRRFLLVSKAECSFDREYYFEPADYEHAALDVRINDFYEKVPFTQEDDEVRVPYKNGEIHVTVPKIQVQETTESWMNDTVPVWWIGDIPQNSLLKVTTPGKLDVRFLVGGKDIMYDGQGLVTLGNVLQSLCNTESLPIAEVEMLVSGCRRKDRYTLTYVCYKEQFLKKPEFWTEDNKLYWNQGGTFIGKAGRTFTLTLTDGKDEPLNFQFDESTESIEIPVDMESGVYQFQISIMTGGIFKKTKEVIAEGDCIIGDPNLLRFKNRRIVIDSITDEFKEEEVYIFIRPCYIDQICFMGMEDTSEGYCPVYEGVMYTPGYHGERYEFSFEKHTNNRGIKKMLVNPVRIVYVNDTALCITDSENDGLYYYNYYDKYQETKVYAITDHEYTKQNRQNYSNADLYSYRTERIKDV